METLPPFVGNQQDPNKMGDETEFSPKNPHLENKEKQNSRTLDYDKKKLTRNASIKSELSLGTEIPAPIESPTESPNLPAPINLDKENMDQFEEKNSESSSQKFSHDLQLGNFFIDIFK